MFCFAFCFVFQVLCRFILFFRVGVCHRWLLQNWVPTWSKLTQWKTINCIRTLRFRKYGHRVIRFRRQIKTDECEPRRSGSLATPSQVPPESCRQYPAIYNTASADREPSPLASDFICFSPSLSTPLLLRADCWRVFAAGWLNCGTTILSVDEKRYQLAYVLAEVDVILYIYR